MAALVEVLSLHRRWYASKGPDLKGFMCRVEALKLYRMYIRTSRLARRDMRESLVEEIRSEFSRRRDVHDVRTIKYLLSDGKTRLKQLQDMLHLQQSL